MSCVKLFNLYYTQSLTKEDKICSAEQWLSNNWKIKGKQVQNYTKMHNLSYNIIHLYTHCNLLLKVYIFANLVVIVLNMFLIFHVLQAIQQPRSEHATRQHVSPTAWLTSWVDQVDWDTPTLYQLMWAPRRLADGSDMALFKPQERQMVIYCAIVIKIIKI